MTALCHSLKCPHCQQYSLTYDWLRNGWRCHVYGGFIPDEHMPAADGWRRMPILSRTRPIDDGITGYGVGLVTAS